MFRIPVTAVATAVTFLFIAIAVLIAGNLIAGPAADRADGPQVVPSTSASASHPTEDNTPWG